jgi:hypothetical protein
MGFKGKLSKKNFSNGITYLLLVTLIEILILKTTMYHKYNFTIKKLTFETNDEHQAKSYQNALRYSVISNNQIKVAGKTNDK